MAHILFNPFRLDPDAAIEVRTPRYTLLRTEGVPDLEACVAALPLCYAAKAGNIHLFMEGERHGRWYSVPEVEKHLGMNPGMRCMFGVGNVDEQFGWNLAPGTHIVVAPHS